MIISNVLVYMLYDVLLCVLNMLGMQNYVMHMIKRVKYYIIIVVLTNGTTIQCPTLSYCFMSYVIVEQWKGKFLCYYTHINHVMINIESSKDI